MGILFSDPGNKSPNFRSQSEPLDGEKGFCQFLIGIKTMDCPVAGLT